MNKYEAWFDGVGEVMMCSHEAKSHAEARRIILSRIVIRKVKE